MSKIIELREQQEQIATAARAKLEEIKDDTTEARVAELEAEFDAAMREYDKLQATIDRMEKVEAAERALLESRRPTGDAGETKGEQAPEYKDVFVKALRFGVGELNSSEQAVMRQHYQSLNEEQRAQTSTTGASGGYTVPTEFSGEIDKAMKAWGPMWDPGVSRELNTANGREIEWPTVDDTAKTGRIKAQNAAVDDDGTDDVAFGQKLLNAYIYDTGVVRVPLELLQDSFFNIDALMNELFAERLGRTCNQELTIGTGTAAPNGVVTASGLGKTAASGTAITADELIDHMHTVDPAYRSSPLTRWMFNDSTLAAIRKLTNANGDFIWTMGDIRVGEPAQIMGHPYSVNQAMPSIGLSAKPIIFGDFSRYIVRKVSGFQVLALRERYAEFFQVGFIGFKRFDGELLNSAAIKHMLMAAA